MTARWGPRATDAAIFGFFGLLVLAYLWPVLVGGKDLGAASVLYDLAPWRAQPPADLGRHINTLLTDIPTAVYPWNVVARSLIHQGMFPAWNPRSLAGTPLFANPQYGVLSPFNVPMWLLPLTFGISVSAALKLWVAGIGTYLLARELGLGRWPGVLGGVAFMFCAFHTGWLSHETLDAVAALFPWMLWRVERLTRHRRQGDVIWLAVVTAIAIAGGHPGTAVQSVGGAALYLAARIACQPAIPRGHRLRLLAMGAAGLALGGLLVAVIVLPTQLAGQGTAGGAHRAGGGSKVPLGGLKTALFPDWWGRPNAVSVPFSANYVVRNVYTGVVPLLLAASALFVRAGWRRKLPLVVVGAVGLAVPFGLPLVRGLVVHLPLFHEVNDDGRMFFLTELAVAILAGFGLQALIDAPREQRAARISIAAGAAISIVAVIAVGPSLHELRVVAHHFRTGADYADRAVLALTSVIWWLLFAAGFAVALIALRARRLSVTAFCVFVLALTLADAAHFVHGFQPMSSPSTALPGTTPGIRYLKTHVGATRVVGFNHTLVNAYDTVFGFRDVRGFDPPQPSLLYYRLWLQAEPNQDIEGQLTVDRPTPQALAVLSLLGAGWIAADPLVTPPIAGRGITRAYAGRDMTLYRNANAVSRAYVPRTVRVVRSDAAAVATVVSPRFVARRDAVARAPAGSVPTTSSGAVSITRDDNADVTLRARMARPGLVVLNDAWARGWSVRVDGRAARRVPANVVMRGVVVPAGTHTIQWHYRIPGFRLGAIVSLLTLVGLLGWGAVLVSRRRRTPADGARPAPSAP